LPHKTKPVPLDRELFEDPDQLVARHLLRLNGFAPWIEEAGEIDRVLTSLHVDLADARRRYAANPPGWQRSARRFRSRAEELKASRRVIDSGNAACGDQIGRK